LGEDEPDSYSNRDVDHSYRSSGGRTECYFIPQCGDHPDLKGEWQRQCRHAFDHDCDECTSNRRDGETRNRCSTKQILGLLFPKKTHVPSAIETKLG
jgi:hypothetical protein